MDANDIPLSWQKWSNNIYIKVNDLALKSQNGNTVNAFYNPEAAKKIKDLMQILPLWTDVMRPHFKCGTQVATSSAVESCFTTYKSKVFKGNIPMRVNINLSLIILIILMACRMRTDFAENDFSSKQLYDDISSDHNKIDAHKTDSSIGISLLNSTTYEHNDTLREKFMIFATKMWHIKRIVKNITFTVHVTIMLVIITARA